MKTNYFVDNTWVCDCGALNSATRKGCGRCGKERKQ